MAPIHISGINLPFVTGPLVLGFMFSSGLFGILIVQMYIYYITFPKDRAVLKALVWFIFSLELLFTIFTSVVAWDDFGTGWGDVDTLLIFDWAWTPLPPITGAVEMMVQFFYCWRIYQFTKFIWLPGFLCSISILQCVVTFYFPIKNDIDGQTVMGLKRLSPFIGVWLSGSATCDILITASMVTILARASSRTSFQQTTSVLTKIIKFTIETGLVTSLAALSELILWLIIPQYNFHFTFFFVLGRLYSNCLLATLNLRAYLRNDGQNIVDVTLPSTFQRGTVRITTTREIQRDEGHEMVAVSQNYDYSTSTTKAGSPYPDITP